MPVQQDELGVLPVVPYTTVFGVLQYQVQCTTSSCIPNIDTGVFATRYSTAVLVLLYNNRDQSRFGPTIYQKVFWGLRETAKIDAECVGPYDVLSPLDMLSLLHTHRSRAQEGYN